MRLTVSCRKKSIQHSTAPLERKEQYIFPDDADRDVGIIRGLRLFVELSKNTQRIE